MDRVVTTVNLSGGVCYDQINWCVMRRHVHEYTAIWGSSDGVGRSVTAGFSWNAANLGCVSTLPLIPFILFCFTTHWRGPVVISPGWVSKYLSKFINIVAHNNARFQKLTKLSALMWKVDTSDAAHIEISLVIWVLHCTPLTASNSKQNVASINHEHFMLFILFCPFPSSSLIV